MDFGLQVSYFSWPGAPASIGPAFGRIARNAEDAGLTSLWVMDHFIQISMIGPPELDMLEGYSALAYAAALTSRIELGTLVTGVTYRHPDVLAKTVTALDVLSGGRAWLGIGEGSAHLVDDGSLLGCDALGGIGDRVAGPEDDGLEPLDLLGRLALEQSDRGPELVHDRQSDLLSGATRRRREALGLEQVAHTLRSCGERAGAGHRHLEGGEEAGVGAGDQRHGAQGGIANGCLLVCSQFSHALIVA